MDVGYKSLLGMKRILSSTDARLRLHLSYQPFHIDDVMNNLLIELIMRIVVVHEHLVLGHHLGLQCLRATKNG